MATGTGSVVILTALDLEYKAVRKHLTDLTLSRKEGTLFEHGRTAGGGEITLTLIEKGNLRAAALAERVREALSPRALLMVGVAGALWDNISLGDIVVAEKIYAPHGGREESDGFLARPHAWDADHELLQLAHRVNWTDSWTRYLPADPVPSSPAVHFAAIAAGEVVLNSRDTPLARQLYRNYNDAAAIEMESAGVAQASGLTRGLPTLTVRGISDKADGAKHDADQAGWQPAAAANAAAFALALAAEIHEAKPGTPDITDSSQRPLIQNVIAYGGNAFGAAGGNVNYYASSSDTPPDQLQDGSQEG